MGAIQDSLSNRCGLSNLTSKLFDRQFLLFEDVYEEMPWHLREQQRAYEDERGSES